MAKVKQKQRPPRKEGYEMKHSATVKCCGQTLIGAKAIYRHINRKHKELSTPYRPKGGRHAGSN